MSRIQIYHDVDGVYNTIPTATTQWRWGWSPGSLRAQRINGYTITWSEQMINEMNDLCAFDNVESFWLTTWRDDAPAMIAPALGIDGADGWQVLHPLDDDDVFDARVRWWKLNAIQQHVEETQPDLVIWLDDDISLDEHALSWIDGRSNVKAVVPAIETGLTRHDLERVAAWIDSV